MISGVRASAGTGWYSFSFLLDKGCMSEGSSYHDGRRTLIGVFGSGAKKCISNYIRILSAVRMAGGERWVTTL
jgi:hypothetical protein